MKTNPFQDIRLKMVRDQIEARGVKDERVLNAMRVVPRHQFVPKEYWNEAYLDHPLPIGNSQTISQPFIVAYMTEILALKGNEKVLEIGTGSGYQAAILAQLAGEVHSVERIDMLAIQAQKRLEELDIKNVQVHIGDGSLGWADAAPYQAILVTAAAPLAPQTLLDQLDFGGNMVIPVGSRYHQILEIWHKNKTGLTSKQMMAVVFVPLIGSEGWKYTEW